MSMTDRVKQILSLVRVGQPGTLHQPRAPAEPRHAGRHRQAGDPPGRPGLRARPGALASSPTPPATIPTTTRSWPSTSGCNAYAAPLGFLEAVAGKLRRARSRSSSSSTTPTRWPRSTSPARRSPRSVKDAVRLGCAAIGYTIYPGSGRAQPAVPGPARADRRGQGARACPPCSGPTRAAPACRRTARRPSTWSPTRRRSPRSSARTSSR